MSPLLFWTFSLLMLVFGVAVVINRNPVASALSLVVSFLGLAVLSMFHSDTLIRLILVMVYAGAVMVLFLFIIMLLDLRAEERRRVSWLPLFGGCAVALALLVQIFYVIRNLKSAHQTFPPLAKSTFDDVRNVGLLLFGNYNLPFQIIGVLVLVATIGVVLLSKRQPR